MKKMIDRIRDIISRNLKNQHKKDRIIKQKKTVMEILTFLKKLIKNTEKQ